MCVIPKKLKKLQARSIHYSGKKKSKGIYGSASKEDLKELKEEGIDAQMIPWIEENENQFLINFPI